ncbi:MAG: TolC family protein [Bacteroidales bacterium]|nr:TolC family protein [Bacteroidales bacterium]
MVNRVIILHLLVIFFAQYVTGQNPVLDNYIRQGLESNHALRQKQLSYEQSLARLEQSKSLFFPRVSLNARYSVADGGRTIDIPVDSLLNPVYNTLNFLLQEEAFPEVDAQSVPFLRSKEHETKLSLRQPVFNADIYYNYKISEQQTKVKQIGVEVYKRELISKIRKAYFNYLKTKRVLHLYKQTLELLEENLRVNRSLYDNNKVTIDAIHKAEAEISEVEQQQAEALKKQKQARAYFNFLINRKLETEIKTDTSLPSVTSAYRAEELKQKAMNQRLELDQLEKRIQLTEQVIEMHHTGGRLPSLNAAVDYGFQGTEYRFTDEYDYVLASLVLKWDLFKGFENRAEIEESKISRAMAKEKLQEVQSQIGLEVISAWYELEAAGKAVVAARKQKQSAESAYQVIRKRYEQGRANYLELKDARTAMTRAKENLIINKYDYKVKDAELRRVAGLDVISRYENPND